MRKSLSWAVVVAALSSGTLAFAQQPIDAYDDGATVAPAPPAPPTPPPPPVVTPVPQPIDPYSAYPAPPAYGYQPPSAGPMVVPSPPQYQQGYYLYAAPGQPPVYYAPPPAVYRPACGGYCSCAQPCCNYRSCAVVHRPVKRWDGVRRFSLGVHGTFLALNQQVGSSNVTLGGMGFQLRMRSSGRFGFEMAQDFLHGSYWGGNFVRDSFPFSVSMMFYIFPNSDARHFNLYGVAGVGIMSDILNLRDENGQMAEQNFTEFSAHAGAGAELRFRWFAIEADARYMGLWRDSSSAPATYYGDIKGAPVNKSSQAVQGNLYLSLWF